MKTGFISRKVLHVALNSMAAIIVWFLPAESLLPIALIVFIAIFLGEVIRLKTKAKKFVYEAVGPLLKKEEKVNFTGLFWAAIAAVIIAFFAKPIEISYAFAILALCDPAAAIVGSYFKTFKLYRNKSLSGSTAFFFIAFIVSLLFFSFTSIINQVVWFSLFMAVVLTIVEMFSYLMDDNFTILVVATLLVHLSAYV